MVWAIVVAAIGVLGVAAWAGTGRLGEMPGPVNDRPKAHIPDGPVDAAFLSDLSLPVAPAGYEPTQVDALLATHVAGDDIAPGTRFDVVRRGYDMQAVDALIDRIGEEALRESTWNADRGKDSATTEAPPGHELRADDVPEDEGEPLATGTAELAGTEGNDQHNTASEAPGGAGTGR